MISFLLMIVVGLGNKIFQKLMTIPMTNYPYFLNLFTTFVYVPVSFAYIIPMIQCGKQITQEQRDIRWYKWAIMGALDGVAGIMQTFATNYIYSGSLIILLLQAAIPISMVISKFLLPNVKYNLQHYVGGFIVLLGLAEVLIPSFLGSTKVFGNASVGISVVWCVVLMLSCVPMTLSSVYKEKAMGDVDLDVIYLNGWVAVYQLIFTVAVAVPAAYASNLTAGELPQNVWDGMKCYVGINSIKEAYTHNGIQIPADNCALSPLFVNIYVAFNLGYNVLIIFILKYGSSNILWLAMTIMVPLANCAFALNFVPNHLPLRVYDIIGLVVIMSGLIIYRFAGVFKDLICGKKQEQ